MRNIFSFLAIAASIYSLLIFIRIIFSWFRNMVSGKPVEILQRITDPYLDWWRRNLNLRIGFIDFSAVAAIVSLYMLQNIFQMLSVTERVSIGNILAIILLSLWSVISFILGFFLIIIVLRAIAYITNRDNLYSPFWSAIDSIYQPLMFRINRVIFINRIGGFLTRIIISFFIIVIIMIGGRLIINLAANILFNLPI
jgi:YggT family protein